MSGKVIYVKAERSIEIEKKEVLLSDIANIFCEDEVLCAKAGCQRIHRFDEKNRDHCVISILKIVEILQQLEKDITVMSLGEPDTVISYYEDKKKSKSGIKLKVVFVFLIVLFGTSFTVMAFHNDIGIRSLFTGVYKVFNVESGTVGILEVMYSVGLAVGITVFFNHIGKKRLTMDPTPIEVEMHIYENDINTALILEASKKGDEIDVM